MAAVVGLFHGVYLVMTLNGGLLLNERRSVGGGVTFPFYSFSSPPSPRSFSVVFHVSFVCVCVCVFADDEVRRDEGRSKTIRLQVKRAAGSRWWGLLSLSLSLYRSVRAVSV